MFEDRAGYHGIENHRDFRGFGFSRAQAAQCALSRRLSHMFGGFKPTQTTSHRKPVVALFGAVIRLRNWHGRERTIRALVFADKSVGVSQDLVTGRGFKRTAFGVFDSGIV